MKKISMVLILFVLLIAGCHGVNNNQIIEERINDQRNNDQVSNDQMNNMDSILTNDEIEALSLAINDEYKAKATYGKVIEKFGEVRPFSNIVKSEQKHIEELKELYNYYNIEIPEDNWYEKVPYFDSVKEACEAGINAEIENAALYDELFSKTQREDIIKVFTALRDASDNNHLPAFQRCGGQK